MSNDFTNVPQFADAEKDVLEQLGFPSSPTRVDGLVLDAIWKLLVIGRAEEWRLVRRFKTAQEQLSLAIQGLKAIKEIKVHGPGAFDSPRKGIADAKAIAIDALNALTMVRAEYVPPADCIYPKEGVIDTPKMDCPAHWLHVPEDQCKTKR